MIDIIRKNRKYILVALAIIIAIAGVYSGMPETAEASNSDFVIFIAPGHTPAENFSRGGISEGQLNEQLSVAIGNALRNAGYTVYLTNPLRWTETDIPSILPAGTQPLESQYSYEKQILPAIEHPENYGVNVDCDLVLSVHHNAAYNSDGSDSSATGLRMYYDSNYSVNTAYPGMNYGRDAQSAEVSKIAATAITNACAQSITYTNTRSVVDIAGTSVKNSICRNCTMAAVLIEAGFLTSPTDLAAARLPENQQALAAAIVNAVNSCRNQIERNTSLTIPGTSAGDVVSIDGVSYTVGSDGTIADVQNGSFAVVYTMHEGSDAYTTYPTGMKVYKLTKSGGGYSVTEMTSFNNIIDYGGVAIRVTGKQGIRVLNGIETNAKAALAGSGLDGYTMAESGLIVAWNDSLGSADLTVDNCAAKATAFVRGSKDPVYSTSGGYKYFTNTLTFTDMSKCKPDLAMRAYIRLTDASGNSSYIYGATIVRSINYIAQANKNAYPAGSSQYEFIWNIINYCNPQTPIMTTSGVTEATRNQMINYYISKAKNKGNISEKNAGYVSTLERDSQGFPKCYGVTLSQFVDMYIAEAQAEGVRADVAFAQMLDETGYLNFGGDVRISQYNFAGLGATGGGASGAQFADLQTGIRAQIQHLKAYASSDSLNNACVDPRYSLVSPHGKAPYVEQLSGAWAANMSYGTDLVNIITAMKAASNADVSSALTVTSAPALTITSPNAEDVAGEDTSAVETEDETGSELTGETADEPDSQTVQTGAGPDSE